jgi:hypothetical protein
LLLNIIFLIVHLQPWPKKTNSAGCPTGCGAPVSLDKAAQTQRSQWETKKHIKGRKTWGNEIFVLLSFAVSTMPRVILLGRQVIGEGANSRLFPDGIYSNDKQFEKK